MFGAPLQRSPDVVAVVFAVSPGSAEILTLKSAEPFTVVVCAPPAVPSRSTATPPDLTWPGLWSGRRSGHHLVR
jgi:hypothetical protein